MPTLRPARLIAVVPMCAAMSALALSACGGSSSSNHSSTPAPAASGTPAGGGAAAGGGGSGGALSAEAQSTATGDIPDNQNFLTFHAAGAGYSILYPEGWTQKGAGSNVTFRDKNNVVRIVVSSGPRPTPSTVTAALARERSQLPSLSIGHPTTLTIAGAPVVKVTYSTQSAPNPVTGKRVRLLVDRYAFAHAGKVAVVDLGTPQGVDNVDAYRMMSHSFRWR
jgi:hypothetical protein